MALPGLTTALNVLSHYPADVVGDVLGQGQGWLYYEEVGRYADAKMAEGNGLVALRKMFKPSEIVQHFVRRDSDNPDEVLFANGFTTKIRECSTPALEMPVPYPDLVARFTALFDAGSVDFDLDAPPPNAIFFSVMEPGRAVTNNAEQARATFQEAKLIMGDLLGQPGDALRWRFPETGRQQSKIKMAHCLFQIEKTADMVQRYFLFATLMGGLCHCDAGKYSGINIVLNSTLDSSMADAQSVDKIKLLVAGCKATTFDQSVRDALRSMVDGTEAWAAHAARAGQDVIDPIIKLPNSAEGTDGYRRLNGMEAMVLKLRFFRQFTPQLLVKELVTNTCSSDAQNAAYQGTKPGKAIQLVDLASVLRLEGVEDFVFSGAVPEGLPPQCGRFGFAYNEDTYEWYGELTVAGAEELLRLLGYII